MAAMIEHRRGDAGKGFALFSTVEGEALRFYLPEFGQVGSGAGDRVAGVFGELDLLHECLLCLGAPAREHGLCGRGSVQGEGMTDFNHDLHRMRRRHLIKHYAVIAGQRSQQRGFARGIAQGDEDEGGGLGEALAAYGRMTEAEELAAGAVGLRVFIALDVAPKGERGGDAEDRVLRHLQRFGHRGERHAFRVPREQLQQI